FFSCSACCDLPLAVVGWSLVTCRAIGAIGAVIVLLLASATAQAQSVPLPRDKPDAASEAEDAAGETEDAGGEDVMQASSCFQDLEAAGVMARRVADFVNEGQCIVEDPVVLEAVDTRNGLLSLPGDPVLDCQFAAALAAWLGEVVSPVAASLLG